MMKVYSVRNNMMVIDENFNIKKLENLPSPYFFIDEYERNVNGYVFEDVDLLSFPYKSKVYKVVVKNSGDLYTARKVFDKTYEADVRYILRLFIDNVLEIADYRDDIIVFFDIETTREGEIISIYAERKDGVGKFFYGEEKKIVCDFMKWLVDNNGIFLLAWNGFKFDFPIVGEKVYHYCNNKMKIFWDLIEKLDYMLVYKKYIGSERLALDYVAKANGIEGKVEHEENIWEMSKDRLEEYNTWDVKIMLELEKKYGLINLAWEIAKMVNIPVSEVVDREYNGRVVGSAKTIHDVSVLRRARELGYVLPTANYDREGDYEGAFVYAKKGVYDWVMFLDFASLYPSIMLNEGYGNEITLGLLKEWYEDRFKYKREWKESGDIKLYYKQYALKILVNCFMPDTYVVGVDGIKRIDEIKVGDKLYTVNLDTNRVEIDEVEKVWEYDWEGDMYAFKNSQYLDLIVTPNHRFVIDGKYEYAEDVYNMKGKERVISPEPMVVEDDEYLDLFEYVKEKFPDYVFTVRFDGHLRRLKSACRLDLNKYKYNGYKKEYVVYVKDMTREEYECIKNNGGKVYVKRKGYGRNYHIPVLYNKVDMAKFMGWFISEGSYSVSKYKDYIYTQRGVSKCILITQKGEYVNEIMDLVDRLGLKYNIRMDKKGVSIIQICSPVLYEYMADVSGMGSYNKHIPDFILNGSVDVRNAFHDSLYKGDGNKKQYRYNTVSKRLAEDLIKLNTSLGYWSRYYKDGNIYRVVRYKTNSNVRKWDKKILKYNGKIYSVTMKKNHNIFAGRNGKFMLVGQSLYGIQAYKGFRLYNKDIASKITAKGRELILSVKHYVENVLGYKVVLIDTDSNAIHVGFYDEDEFELLKSKVNKYIYPYRMEIDKIFKRMIVFKKKRYAGLNMDGEFKYKGLEIVRGDVFDLEREIQRNILERFLLYGYDKMWLDGYMSDMKRRLWRGEFDDKLIYIKGVKDSWDEYKANTPQLRAWKKLGNRDVLFVEYYWARGGDVEPVIDGKILKPIDYKYYWNMIISMVDRLKEPFVEQKTLFGFGGE